MEWFNDAKFGIFLHWGIYSIPAYDNVACAKLRKIGNGSEWYLGRLIKTFRPSFSDNDTKAFHKKHYGDASYFDFMKSFDGKNFDADKWCSYFKSIGAKYFVITSKHHDGFCLWPTKTTEMNVMNTPLKRDVIGELRKAATKYGLKFGIYYSWMEFGKSVTNKYVNDTVWKQLGELAKYKPDLYWMDGDWVATSDKWKSEQFLKMAHERGAIVNSRLGKGNLKGDYDNFADRYLPETKMDAKYESCWTVGLSWGYNKMQKSTDYKSPEELADIYKKIQDTNGNMLLNFAVDQSGNFDDTERKVVDKFSKLIGL